ncbi:MAG: carbohydrate ABC transporter permease [Acidimicrobiia bacterium]|nr:carbohydrate ABC transporter permease [Acidimicrobiia bacterium]
MSTTTIDTDGPPPDVAPAQPRRRISGRTLAYIVLGGALVLYLGPFIIQAVTSFKTDPDAAANPVSLVPDPLTTDAWNTVAGNNPAINAPILRWLGNSFIVTLCVTSGRVALASLAGYALARIKFPGRRLVAGGLLAVLAVPGIVLLIPKFLILQRLDMFDTYAGMILPLLADAVGILLMKAAFEAVPYELEEAALIDGAGVFMRFRKIVLPLTTPALITVVIISFQGSWNEFTHFLVATSDPDKATLNLGIARLTAGDLSGGTQFPLKLALATLATLPIAIVYIVFSRQFTRSIASSGIK